MAHLRRSFLLALPALTRSHLELTSASNRNLVTALLVRDGGARGTGEGDDVYLFEPGLFAPAGKVAAREIKRVAELDQHVERHQQPECVFAAGVINDVLDCDESTTLRQRVVGGFDELLLVLEVPVVEDQPHGD